ncbi:MAG TPA: tetratricopeptide repeat protein [Planctomycetota bacterium]|jgi:tetratricopeptide (TPR) repeat protein|nr:tetratricopeptide repeat protein [Planctomycetota bacterium]
MRGRVLLWIACSLAQGPAGDLGRILDQARLALGAGKTEEALALLERAQALEPGSPDVQLLLGFVQYRRRDYPRAQDHLERVLAFLPGNPEALFGLGSVAYDQGLYDLAKARLEGCLAANARDGRASYLLGEIHSHREEFGLACKHYRLAIEIGKEQEKGAAAGGPPLSVPLGEALQGLGLALYNLRELEESGKAYEEALGRAPDDPETAYGLSLVRMKSGDPAAAIPLLDRVLDRKPDHVGARYQRGLAREKRGDLAGAIEDYREGVALDAAHKGMMLSLGRALVRLSRSRPGDEGERLRREGEGWERRYAAVSEVVDDLHETSRRAAREPRNAGVKLKLCTLYGQMGDVARAAEQARKAAALRPELGRDPIVLGLVRLAEGKVEEARANFEAAIRMKPDFADSYLFLSLAEEKAGRSAEAERLRGEFRRRERAKGPGKEKGS